MVVISVRLEWDEGGVECVETVDSVMSLFAEMFKNGHHVAASNPHSLRVFLSHNRSF